MGAVRGGGATGRKRSKQGGRAVVSHGGGGRELRWAAAGCGGLWWLVEARACGGCLWVGWVSVWIPHSPETNVHPSRAAAAPLEPNLTCAAQRTGFSHCH